MSHRLNTPGWRSVSAHSDCIQPLYGRISDLLGRRVGEFEKATTNFALVSSILLFALGSLLCGAARVCNFPDDCPFVVMFSRDLRWLIDSRALSGVGEGGIASFVWVITTEIVEVPKREK